MLGDLFTFRLESDDLEKNVVHRLHSLERREIEELFSFLIFYSVYDRLLHGNSVSNMSGIYKAILSGSDSGRSREKNSPGQTIFRSTRWAIRRTFSPTYGTSFLKYLDEWGTVREEVADQNRPRIHPNELSDAQLIAIACPLERQVEQVCYRREKSFEDFDKTF